MKKISGLEELKQESMKGAEFFILLASVIRSTKHIRWDPEAKQFHIINRVDGSSQHLTEEQMMDKDVTNIGEAIRKGAFYKD